MTHRMKSFLKKFIIAAFLIKTSSSFAIGQDIPPPSTQDGGTRQATPGQAWGLPVRIISEPEASAKDQIKQEEAIQREIDDLSAQKGMEAATVSIDAATRDMRDYAKYSLVLSWISLLVGGLSTILLLLTLRQSIKANKIASISSDAAVNSVAVAQSLGRIQSRPYLGVTEAQIVQADGSGSRFNVLLTVKNFGSTPARKVRWSSEHNLAFNFPKISKDEADAIEEMRRMSDVNPNQEILLYSPLPEDLVKNWVSATAISSVFQYHFFGRIDYVDLFDVERRQYFGCQSKVGSSFRLTELLVNPDFNFDFDLSHQLDRQKN